MHTLTNRLQLLTKTSLDTTRLYKYCRAGWEKMTGYITDKQHNAPVVSTTNDQGKVFIVGAGPGDADLLTMKAVKVIQQADIVLFDALVSEDVLAIIPNHVGREFVGKRCGKHSMSQQDICQKVVALAASGLTVVRLKGGDPALFARTCEETTALSAAQIPFAIVPGITAASGMSAYTGIPLTDRRCAQAVSFITAHFSDPDTWPDMQRLSATMQQQTVVVYMGLSRFGLLSARLQAAGLSADWPVAAVENATSEKQTILTGSLSTLPQRVKQANLTGPTLLVFGKVVESKQDVSLSLLQSNHHVTAI